MSLFKSSKGRRSPAERSRRGRCGHALDLEIMASDQRVAQGYEQAAKQTVERLAGRSEGRGLSALEPFYSLLSESWRMEEVAASGRPVVGTVCNFVPEEVILALGAIPLRVELGLGVAAEVGQRVLPADICPEIRALMGAHLGGLPALASADLLVIPTACDGKKKLVSLLGSNREVWMMALPQIRGAPGSVRQWTEEVQALVSRLEDLTGRRLRRGPLRQAAELLNRRTALARRLNELRWANPTLISGGDAFAVLQSSFVADPTWWAEKASALIGELEDRSAEARGGESEDEPVRLLVTGSPILFPDLTLLQVVEETGAVVVADEMCSGTQRLYNPVVIDEGTVNGMLRALSERSLLPCTCPCFGSAEVRIDRILDLCRRSRTQGVIHHTLRLCQLFDLEVGLVAAALKQAEIPLLNVYAEFGAEAATLKNRVEAFVEMISL